MNKTVSLYTLGCKLNFAETSTIGKQFIGRGYSVVHENETADVYVINTCTVTENAEKDCRQYVRRVLRKNPDAFVIVTGCYAQLRPEEIAAIDGVDLVLGSKEKFDVFSYIKDESKNGIACIFTSPTEDLNSGFGKAFSSEADSRTRAYFKIQDGCDYKCSFCTIPLARGKSRSMNPDDAVRQFENLVEDGYKEIILTGVNVGDYTAEGNFNLYGLLKEFAGIEGEFRMRISSIEPNLLTREIIELVASNDKFCNHFHIPLQSGSDKILRLMQRRYTVQEYKRVIHTVNEIIPDAGIGVDVISGFPGETNEDFLETHNFLRDLPVSYLHPFTYSERPDTKAITMPGSVDVAERRKRTNVLRILSDKKRFEFFSRFSGETVDVLFESDETDGKIKGFSSNYIRCEAAFNRDLVNKIIPVKILSASANICASEIALEKTESLN